MTKKKIRTEKLPDKPSDLIDLALADLTKVEQLPEQYKVDMGQWHEPNSHCTVCLAGAVMAMSMDACEKSSLSPCDFEENGNEEKLLALNYFREGDITSGLEMMETNTEMAWSLVDVPRYLDNPSGFKEAVQGISLALRAADL